MDASLFLTEVDIHHPRPLLGKKLRAYLFQHGLFFDKMLVGDSQFNNNLAFRQVIWERDNQGNQPDHLQDMWQLVENGYLTPAIRNEYGSLTSLRKDHVNRQVSNVPSEEYTQFIDEKINKSLETYNIRDVAVAFRERVLEALDYPGNTGKGRVGKKVAQHVKDYVLRQDPLLYDSFRKWMRNEITDNRLTERDYRLVDRITAGAYRHNVAIALNKNLDIPLSHTRDVYPLTITMGSLDSINQHSDQTSASIHPTVYLSEKILCDMPAKALITVKKHSSNYARVVRDLETFRSTQQIDFENFAGNLEQYLAEVEMIFNDFVTNKQKSEIQSIKRKGIKEAILNGIIDVGLSIVNFIIPYGSVFTAPLNGFGFFHAAKGMISDIRSASRQTERLKGYILGRSNSLEKIYEIKK